jgi:hypothetical protein
MRSCWLTAAARSNALIFFSASAWKLDTFRPSNVNR